MFRGRRKLFEKGLSFLITISILVSITATAYAAEDPKVQISAVLKSLLQSRKAKVTCIIKDKNVLYKEVKLNGTARIVYKNGKYQLDDEKKLLSGASETNYYFAGIGNNIVVTDPDTIGRFETIHVANKYFSVYKKGYQSDRNYILWKTSKTISGPELMDQYYKEIDKEKHILEDENFKDELKDKTALFTDQIKSAPYNYLVNGETLTFSKMAKNAAVEIGVEAVFSYVLKNFSPYPNYRFRDFLNTMYYTWYNTVNNEKTKVKELFKKDYIDNFTDASMFLKHINTIFILSSTYPFILKYINGKIVSEKSDYEKILAFAKSLTASPFDKGEGSLEGFELLTGLPDGEKLLANDYLSSYMRTAYANKTDIFKALSIYDDGRAENAAGNQYVRAWASTVKRLENSSGKMISDSIKYGQTGYLAALISNDADSATDSQGVTIGNLKNEGLVCSDGDWVYYVNLSDSNKLYKMKKDGTGKKKLSNDRCYSLNIKDDFLYYISEELIDNGAVIQSKLDICSIKTDGTGKAKLTSFKENNAIRGNIQVVNDSIYFLHEKLSPEYIPCYDLEKLDIKTKKTQHLFAGSKIPTFAIYGSDLYYVENGTIYKTSLDQIKPVSLCKTDFLTSTNYFIVQNGWIYYSAYKNGQEFHRVKVDGTQDTRLIRFDKSFGYSVNIKGGYIYYTDFSKGCNIYRVKTDGSGALKLSDGKCSSLNIIDDYIYYVESRSGVFSHSAGVGFNKLYDQNLIRIKLDGNDKKEI